MKEDESMSKIDLVRAWKDPIYRAGLDPGRRANMEHPSGLVGLSDDQLKRASGIGGVIVTTFRTCTEFTFRRYQCCK
jgi:mersacidin/lichenicidin family type 2 lantibiotic